MRNNTYKKQWRVITPATPADKRDPFSVSLGKNRPRLPGGPPKAFRRPKWG